MIEGRGQTHGSAHLTLHVLWRRGATGVQLDAAGRGAGVGAAAPSHLRHVCACRSRWTLATGYKLCVMMEDDDDEELDR